MGLLNRIRSRKAAQCKWIGAHSGPAIAEVVTEEACGHHRGTTPTCWRHLEILHAGGGAACIATTCELCGTVGIRRVVGTADIA